MAEPEVSPLALAELVDLARAGNRDAERQLFGLLHARIHALAKRKIWDPEAAEDLAQETLRTAYEKYRTAELPRGLLPWIFAILHHKAGNYLKRLRVERRHVQPAGGEPDWDNVRSVADEAGRAELMESLEKALAGAAPACRTILRLLLEGASREDLHRAFAGEPAGTVDSRISRCRARLLDELRRFAEEVGGR